MQINKDWFFQKLDDQRKTLRGLARHMEIDPSQASRMLSGKRKMRIDEANKIASFLAAPVTEVLKHAGVSMDEVGLPTGILLAATINELGQLERLTEPKPLPQAVIERAKDAMAGAGAGAGKILAAQIRAPEGPLSVMDDAVVLYKHTDDFELAAIGALAICRAHDGEQIMGKIERARKTGEARITTSEGKKREAILQTATPVLAIIP